MNFIPVDAVVFTRSLLGAAALAMMASCTTPQGGGTADPAVFSLSDAERKERFPRVQNIGIVELSGARLQARIHGSSGDEKEYLASGGAMLVKRVANPIMAHAPEILVTPDAAVLRGAQAMVQHEGRLITGTASGTKITIDGTRVDIDGPHTIRNLSTGNVTVVGAPPVKETPAPAAAAEKPVVETAVAPTPDKPEAEATQPAAQPEKKSLFGRRAKKEQPVADAAAVPAETKPDVAEVPPTAPAPKAAPAKPKAPAKSKSAPAKSRPATSKPAAKPTAPAPKPAAAPATDRKQLLELMREPSE